MRSPALRGTIIALASAVLFGVTTPIVQRLGRGMGPFTTAALLYAGAAIAGGLGRSRREEQPTRVHLARITAMAIAGAAAAPVLLAMGLARASGTAASLMLNLEAVFTIVLARVMHHEHIGGRVAAASLVLLAGGALLVVDHGGGGTTSAIGLACVAGASLAWAFDNALSKPLSPLDPSAVVGVKGLLGATCAVAVAFALGESWPPRAAALGLLVIGATGYGLSLRLYLLAQRSLGAGRTASVFASAPFCGAALALALGEPAGLLTLAGAAAMIVGLFLHATERHEHPHVHRAIEHAHPHRHDDAHHSHTHDPMPQGEHTHAHRHEETRHAHPHVPDVHHEHDH